MPKFSEAIAPSQAFLYGEHAVLYGSPALAMSVDVKTRARVTEVEDRIIEIRSDRFPEGLRWRYDEEQPEENPLLPLAYGLRDLMKRYEFNKGLIVEISSDVPVSSGMASSASVSAAISAAFLSLVGESPEKYLLLDIVYEFERRIHGRASKTGPACAVLGGLVWVEWRDGNMEVSRIDSKDDLSIVISCSGLPSETKKLVSMVSKRYNEIRDVMDRIMHAISALTVEGRRAIEKRDLVRAGELMNINHGLLSAIGVSNYVLDEIVWTMRRLGAYGAKLSGAGGGGCVIGLSENPEVLAKNLSASYPSFAAKVSLEGVRVIR
jgi:mevalonate kinase